MPAREARLFGLDPGGLGDLGGAIDTMDDDASVVAHRNAGHRVDLGEVEALTRASRARPPVGYPAARFRVIRGGRVTGVLE